MKKLIIFCCFVVGNGLLASISDSLKLGDIVVRNNGIAKPDDKVCTEVFTYYSNRGLLGSDKKFSTLLHEILQSGYDKCLEACRNMSITSKFWHLFSRGQKAGCILAGLVVLPLAVYGACNLVPVIAKKYRAKYRTDDE